MFLSRSPTRIVRSSANPSSLTFFEWLYAPTFGESAFSVAAPDFDLGLGGKLALLRDSHELPPEEPEEPVEGPHDPEDE